MSSVPRHAVLTERQLNFCEYGGAFGILLTLTCLIQHLIVAIDNWVTQLMIFYYVFAIVVFLLLALKKSFSPILVIVSGALSFIMQVIWMRDEAFSAVVVFLFIYHVGIVVCLYVEKIPGKLRQRRKLELEERNNWAGKI